MMISNDAAKKIVQLHVNGETHDAVIRSADTLLHTLREQLGLTAAKPACENGIVGPVRSSLTDNRCTHVFL